MDNPTTTNPSPLQDRRGQLDIADSLRTAGVAPQRMMDLEHGKTLAQWQNRQGEVRYEPMIKQQRVFPQNLWITVLATQG